MTGKRQHPDSTAEIKSVLGVLKGWPGGELEETTSGPEYPKIHRGKSVCYSVTRRAVNGAEPILDGVQERTEDEVEIALW